MTVKTKRSKKKKIRNNEYYDTQKMFDNLYQRSSNNCMFKNLIKFIISSENILLAYRNIRKNKGSKTCGTNKNNIISIGKKNPKKLIEYVRSRLENFKPHSVRRKEIPKENGETRPLGIPTIEDRLIQQCILQVLEPICEAKFYNHSYGFRPNRSTRDAVARANFLTSRNDFQYVVDIDIKGFFNNVNHAKLLKQMWTLGIRDKNFICIISKMLKAEIIGEGIPDKGVPQGGLLSPLLANIVLNEFDWWIASQWEYFKMKNEYSSHSYEYKLLIRIAASLFVMWQLNIHRKKRFFNRNLTMKNFPKRRIISGRKGDEIDISKKNLRSGTVPQGGFGLLLSGKPCGRKRRMFSGCTQYRRGFEVLKNNGIQGVQGT